MIFFVRMRKKEAGYDCLFSVICTVLFMPGNRQGQAVQVISVYNSMRILIIYANHQNISLAC